MAQYFLKANLDGVEIEFNTKDRNIVEAQLNEYFELITGNKPKQTTNTIMTEKAYQNINNQYQTSSNETCKDTEREENKPQDTVQALNFNNFENYENPKVEVREETISQNTSEIISQNTSFGDIFKSKTENQELDEKTAIEYENIEIKKENIVEPEDTSGLNLYQPKVTPELPEFMLNKVSKGIFDDFIISAYYIKNVLNEKKFSIKYLNSKLYRAKEKLVDFAILNEAISRNLIEIVESQDYTKEYTITEEGNNYYLGLENK